MDWEELQCPSHCKGLHLKIFKQYSQYYLLNQEDSDVW